eukprot:s4932_g2.t2
MIMALPIPNQAAQVSQNCDAAAEATLLHSVANVSVCLSSSDASQICKGTAKSCVVDARGNWRVALFQKLRSFGRLPGIIGEVPVSVQICLWEAAEHCPWHLSSEACRDNACIQVEPSLVALKMQILSFCIESVWTTIYKYSLETYSIIATIVVLFVSFRDLGIPRQGSI